MPAAGALNFAGRGAACIIKRRRMDIHHQSSSGHSIENLKVPAFLATSDGVITAVNKLASGLMFGADLRSPTESHLSDLLCPLNARLVLSWMQNADKSSAKETHLNIILSQAAIPELWSVCKLKHRGESSKEFIFQQIITLPLISDHESVTDSETPPAPNEVEDLIRSEERWKTAVLSANQGVWDHDFELDRHFLSDSWHELRGLSREAGAFETTEDWLKTIHPDDLERVNKQIALQESGETDIVNYTFRQKNADGHWIWILSRGRVVRRTSDGLPARIIGTDTDISDLKSAEHERIRLAQRLRIAIEASEMGQWELDIGTDTAFWDDQALRMFELNDNVNTRPETDWAAMVHPADRKSTVAYNDACVRDRKDMASEYRILTASGKEKYIRSRGRYIQDAEWGDRYIGVNLDLTEFYQKTVELERARSRLEFESRHDPLTGLANRRRLDEGFAALAAEDAASRVIGAMHLDIDRFKQINDTFGHDAGDFTLKRVAIILLKSLPEDVLIARIGGDEFVALFPPGLKLGRMEQFAKAILKEFEEPFVYKKIRINVGISIGIALVDRDDQSKHKLFLFADIALYDAKKNGRGTFCSYNPKMYEEAKQRIRLQQEMMDAFDRNEITCYYQPQFNAQTLQLSGLEALVRWESPTHGIVGPDTFLKTVEDMGLIAKLDEIVLSRALADLGEWNGEGLSPPHISVNVSAQRLADPAMKEWLMKMNISPGTIVFELLESVFLDGDNAAIRENLDLLEKMGIDVEIDDFGTGHASIVSLLRVAPKRLKIDRELVSPIVSSLKRRALLETIIRIGKMLDIEVIAEGVETTEHLEILRALKCDFLQGFALGKPMTAKDVRKLLISR